MPKIIIAPNAFKNSLDATAAASALAEGIRELDANAELHCFPVGDGGDGTAALLIDRLQAERIVVPACDPLGRPLETVLGWLPASQTAIVEMADASGIRRLKPSEYNPLQANSAGTGMQIAAALRLGAKRLLLGVGGSATVDGGLGLLSALGFRFLEQSGKPIESPEALVQLDAIDSSSLLPGLAALEWTVLCDVDNPLLGASGAVAVFGPQKGANPTMVNQLEASLKRLSEVMSRKTGRNSSDLPHSGAAGGVAASLSSLLNAHLVNGIDYFLEITRFEQWLGGADYVLTGEGSIDAQTLGGKAPVGVARMAKRQNLPVIVFAGKIADADDPLMKKYFDRLIAINPPEMPLEEALRSARQQLKRAAHAWYAALE